MLRGVRYSNLSPVPSSIRVSASLAPSPAETAWDLWSRMTSGDIDELQAGLAGERCKRLRERLARECRR